MPICTPSCGHTGHKLQHVLCIHLSLSSLLAFAPAVLPVQRALATLTICTALEADRTGGDAIWIIQGRDVKDWPWQRPWAQVKRVDHTEQLGMGQARDNPVLPIPGAWEPGLSKHLPLRQQQATAALGGHGKCPL